MEYGKYTFDKFEFVNGKVLENVVVDYILKGTPCYDEDGNITNAIVFCHNYEGNASSLADFSQLTSEGNPFDFNDYFFISISSIGVPDSCSPSTTGLRYNFPEYNFLDRVNFKRKFLREKLNMDKVLGITGRGLGGYEVYTWACEYPDDMKFIIVDSSAYRTTGYRYVVAKGIESIIDSSENYYSELYSESLSKMMVSINRLLYSSYSSRNTFDAMSKDEIDVLMDDYVDDGLFIDIYDFKFQNDAIIQYDVENQLKNIKAKALIISPYEDLYYSPKFDTIPLKNLIDDCELLMFEFNKNQINDVDYNFFIDELTSFLENFKK